MSIWTSLAKLILRRARLIIAIVLLGTILMALGTRHLTTDHRAGRFYPATSQIHQDHLRFGELFGLSQTVFYILVDQDAGAPDQLTKMASFETMLEQRPGIDDVLSLASFPDLSEADPRVLFDPGLSAQALDERLTANQLARKLFLSRDGASFLLVIKLNEAVDETPERMDVVNRVEDDALAIWPSAEFAGFPYLRTAYANNIIQEMPLFTGLAVAVAIVLLLLAFRSLKVVVLPTLVVAIGLIWTLGLMGWTGHQFNVASSLIPALIAVIGMANSIHLSSKYFDLIRHHDPATALTKTIETAGFATFLACLTTAVGFAALVFSGSEKLMAFGLYAGAGIMMLYALSVTIIPAAFVIAGHVNPRTISSSNSPWLTTTFGFIAQFTKRRRTAILVAALLILGIGILGSLSIPTGVNVFADFEGYGRVDSGLKKFEAKFGGVLPMEVAISSEQAGTFQSHPAIMNVAQVQTELTALEDVKRSLSYSDLVKGLVQAFSGGAPEQYRLPGALEMPLIAQRLRDRGDGGVVAGQSVSTYVDPEFRHARITLAISDLGTARMNDLKERVREVVRGVFPEDRYEVIVTGPAITATQSFASLVRNLMVTLAIALLIVSLLMFRLFRSIRLTAISVLPNVIPLVLVGGAMGFLGIGLVPSTALIFSVAFGIAVDDTIHFLARYHIATGSGLDNEAAINVSLRETGKAILFTSLILIGGFSVLTLSGFSGTVNLGRLTALTLALALLTNVLLLPALLHQFGEPKKAMASQ